LSVAAAQELTQHEEADVEMAGDFSEADVNDVPDPQPEVQGHQGESDLEDLDGVDLGGQQSVAFQPTQSAESLRNLQFHEWVTRFVAAGSAAVTAAGRSRPLVKGLSLLLFRSVGEPGPRGHIASTSGLALGNVPKWSAEVCGVRCQGVLGGTLQAAGGWPADGIANRRLV
jgi:hypothetical protein